MSADDVRRAPKVLLHDHLDGGLRPQSVIELAAEVGYDVLPETDAESLGTWFRESADSGSLPRYLETFDHTLAVMQTREGLFRVASECAQDHAVGREVLGTLAGHAKQPFACLHHREGVVEGLEVARQRTRVGALAEPRAESVGLGLGELVIADLSGEFDDRLGTHTTVEVP